MSEFTFVVDQQALDVVKQTSIGANFDECKAALTEMMAPYKNLVVTADGVASAKSDRARIHKVSERINEQRKAVKQVYMSKYALFENRCKELCAICDESAENLDVQIKAFDEERKQEKMDALREFFNAHATDEATSYITFDAICNPRWANVTYSEEEAHKEILREIAACVTSVNAIRTLKSPMEAALLDYYRQTRDLAGCMSKHEQLMRLREQEERRKAEIERLRLEQIEAAQKKNAEEAEKSAVVYAPTDEEEEPSEPVRIIDFRVYVNAAQAAALKAFLKENNIQYGPVPKE